MVVSCKEWDVKGNTSGPPPIARCFPVMAQFTEIVRHLL
jgi:hypothetical protein